jgi:hypothetical protein
LDRHQWQPLQLMPFPSGMMGLQLERSATRNRAQTPIQQLTVEQTHGADDGVNPLTWPGWKWGQHGSATQSDSLPFPYLEDQPPQLVQEKGGWRVTRLSNPAHFLALWCLPRCFIQAHTVPSLSYYCFVCLYFQALDSGHWVCKAGALPLEPPLQPICF